MPWLVGLFSTIGSAIGGLFSFKKAQTDVVKEALTTLASVESTDAQVSQASAEVLTAIMNNGSFLERNWRPALMILIIAIIGSFWFGYTPPHLNEALPPMMERIFTLLEIGLIGYMPLRSIDKWVKMFQVGSLLKTLIAKKVL